MQENLKRTIGVFGLACAVVNMTVGTGIFVLPALVAEHVGAAAIICFLICGLLIFLIALCFAEVGSKVTVSGGPYTYIEAAFGSYAGFIANITFLTSCVLADAGTAMALSKTLSFFIPVLDAPAVRPLFFLLLFGILAFINIRGAKQGVQFVVFTTFAKIIPLLLLVAVGTGHIKAENLQWKTGFTFGDIGNASILLFFAFVGLETAVTNGGEFKNPARTVPLGILSGLFFVLILYIAIQLVTQGVLGNEIAAAKEAPVAAVSQKIFGAAGISIIVLGTAISMIGGISGEVLGIPRILYAGARDGLLPKFLFKVHPKFKTPHYAILVYTGAGFVLALFGGLQQLLILSSAGILLIYLGVVLSTIKFRYKKITRDEKTFMVPGGIIIPVIATVAIVWMLSNLKTEEKTGIAIALVVLTVIYFLMRMFKKENKL
jgi:basic amino acid/polyamine antiporter, APA family